MTTTRRTLLLSAGATLAAPAILGNTGATSMGTTDPFANFSH